MTRTSEMDFLESLKNLSSSCILTLNDSRGLFRKALLSLQDGPTETVYSLMGLAETCLQSSESAAILVRERRLLDADILLRAVTEGTYKFLFLCERDPETRDARAREFWCDLPEAARIRRHLGAKRFLAIAETEDASIFKPIRDLLLEESELQDLYNRFPKKARRQLEYRWSFNKLGEMLARSDLPGGEAFIGLAYTYGTGSHLTHKDAESIKMMWERETRNPRRRNALELAHGARLLSDIFHMNITRIIGGLLLVGMTPFLAEAFRERHSEFLQQLEKLYVYWHRVEYGVPPTELG